VLFDAVIAEILFLTKMEFFIPGGISPSVDDGISAVNRHFLEDNGLCAPTCRFRRSRKSCKP
jgi:hypothetical protein